MTIASFFINHSQGLTILSHRTKILPFCECPLGLKTASREERPITTIFIPIEQIQVSVKNRRRVNRRKVELYATHYDMGDSFPPIKVEANGDFFTVWDGRHRFMAQLMAGYPVIEAVVVAGTRKEERVLFRKLLAAIRVAKQSLAPKRSSASFQFA